MQIQLNGEALDVEQDVTVAQMLAQLEIQTNQIAVEVNLEVVPRTEHETFTLHEGDAIEIVTLVGGG
ncbi:MAG: thiamine biosynthesis protein ThiS [Blastopirellula sp.]|nr:thiamine biosynthesis protein ThiS [Blastopirellula sp.]